MPGRSSKYTVAQNAQLEIYALDVLINAERPLNIEEIINSNMNLMGHSSQKMSRILNSLVERGTALKGQDKVTKRVTYVVNR